MKLPLYNHQQNYYDSYSQFYNQHRHFIRFENDEFMFTGNIHIDARIKFPEFNLHVLSTYVPPPMPFYYQGELIRQSWLLHAAQQHFILDYDTKVITGVLQYRNDDRTKLIPKNKQQRCQVYWANPDTLPIGAAIKFAKPNKYTPELNKYFKHLLVTAKFVIQQPSQSTNILSNLYLADLQEAMEADRPPLELLDQMSPGNIHRLLTGKKAVIGRNISEALYLHIK